MIRHVLALCLAVGGSGPGAAAAQAVTATPHSVTVATLSAGLTRRGPGLLLDEITRAPTPDMRAVIDLIAARAPDILLLTGIDWDLEGAALSALADRLSQAGPGYPHRFAPRPNRGLPSGQDLDGDGRLGGPGDAQGWGPFSGAGGMALLSRWPLGTAQAVDFTAMLWRDLPDARLPITDSGRPFPTPQAQQVQRLSSTGHWAVAASLPGGARIWLAALSATAPVFDGDEDRNGLRNADEIALFAQWLDAALPAPPPAAPVIVLGRLNLDPVDGAGRHTDLARLTDHPRLQDPRPRGTPLPQQAGHIGDPALDTARFTPPPDGPGALRVDYILPDRALTVTASGIDWSPDPGLTGGLVWVTLTLP